MANPFSTTNVVNYNTNPPPDDGTQVASNRLQWANHINKIGNPIKTAFDTSETTTQAAFGKIPGGAGITSTAIDYQVQPTDQGGLIKVTVAGKIITTPDATSVGEPFLFRVVNLSNGTITLDGSGAQTIDGQLTVTIPSGAGMMVDTDGSNWFSTGQNFTSTQVVPQGRLTLVSATPVIASDQIAATAVFYTPTNGNLVPIPNGSVFRDQQFAELTLTLAAQHLADTIYDVFVFLNPADNATVVVGTGPAWSNSAAGTCARGTGAGTTELSRLQGLNVNNVAATMRNGATTYSVAAKSATYVGSIYTDHTAGQVTCHLGYGQNRKYGVWNCFNRQRIYLKAGDSTASWSNPGASFRASNNAPATWSSAAFNVGSGTVCNGLLVFVGLAEEYYNINFNQVVSLVAAQTGSIGIGFNSVTVASGQQASWSQGVVTNLSGLFTQLANFRSPPALGINTVASLEKSSNSSLNVFDGTEANMVLVAEYMA